MSVYFSGPPRTRQPFERVAQRRGITIANDVRGATSSIFDVSTFAAPTYHELGIALALRQSVLLIADVGTDPPFDLGRHAHYYEPDDPHLDRFLETHIDEPVTLAWEEMLPAVREALDLNGLDASVCLEMGIADALGRHTVLLADEDAIQRLPRDFPAAVGRVSPYTSADTRR